MAFKAMRKNRTRKRYECLSSSAGTTKDSYDDSDFFPFAAKSDHSVVSRPSSSFDHIEMNNVDVQQRHHRGWSVGDFSSMSCREGKRSGVDGGDIGFSPSRRGQLVRNRSHRLFSCVSGEWFVHISNKLKSQLNKKKFASFFVLMLIFHYESLKLSGEKTQFCVLLAVWVIFRYCCVKFWGLSKTVLIIWGSKDKKKTL